MINSKKFVIVLKKYCVKTRFYLKKHVEYCRCHRLDRSSALNVLLLKNFFLTSFFFFLNFKFYFFLSL